MFIDFRTHPKDQLIETDVCVIGAGAAGISLAHALAGGQLNVCLLETGGFAPDPAQSELTRTADQIGNYATSGCRLRFFGGSTNHWAGNNMPLEELDFAERPWVTDSGWPIDRATLDPWYEQANTLLNAGAFAYTEDSIRDDSWPFPDLNFTLLREVYWRVTPDPTSFSKVFRKSFETTENLRVYINATVTGLHANGEGNNVTHATVKDTGGNTARIKAKYFIVAAGALESSRLLLASRDVVPAGLGNESDNVGRYFMMHPHIDIGEAYDLDPAVSSLFDHHRHNGVEVIAGISASPESQRTEEILNGGIMLQGLPDQDSGYSAMLRMRTALTRRYQAWRADFPGVELDDEFGDWAWLALTDFDSVVRGIWKRSQDPEFEGESRRGAANIYLQSEQAPNRDSRITLGAETDTLGVPKMITDCRVLPIDKKTLRVTGELLGRELGARNGGRVKLKEWLLDDGVEWDRQIWGGCHHIGTTRMSATPRNGVVNADCRLHSVDNTFVASSSVFATGGHANPTITIVALALRLADHIKKISA